MRTTLTALTMALMLTGGLAVGHDHSGETEAKAEKKEAYKEKKPTERKVAATAEETKPLAKGTKAPATWMRNMEGEKVHLSSLHDEGATLLVFYRGGWCPYCTVHLAELGEITDDLRAHGVRLVGVSPDTPEHLRKTAEEKDVAYELYSDSGGAAATAFGVAFAVDDEGNERLKGYGIDLAEWSGGAKRVLPVPAVFLIDQKGTIQFSHSNPDYRERISNEDLLAAVREATTATAGK